MDRSPRLRFFRYSGRLLWRGLLALWGVMKRGDTNTGALTFTLVIAGVGAGVGTAATSFFRELPWEVPAVIFLALLFYGLCRASYEEVGEANKKAERAERQRDELQEKLDRQRDRLRLVLQKSRQQRQRLREDKDALERELAAERAVSRELFSQEELRNRLIEGRAFHVTDLARESEIIRGWTFEGCNILGPAVVAPFRNTFIDEATRWAGDDAESINLISTPDRRNHIGAIGLDGCSIRRCTFVGVGKLSAPRDEAEEA